jgi:hypothetical protein
MRWNSRNKYGAQKTEIDGLRFDSKKEAMRWLELKKLEGIGVIAKLERQISIPLHVAGVKVCTYRADFMYEMDGATIVEDAKGYQTDVFKLKWKIGQALFPLYKWVIS